MEYISLEVAKLAMKAGFDWKCVNYYHCVNYDGNSPEVRFKQNIEPANRNHSSYAWQYSAPTVSELCKWLREEHKIWINLSFDLYTYAADILHPEYCKDTKEQYYSYVDLGLLSDNTAVTSYEKAMEKCLSDALNIIIDNDKISKNKNINNQT